MTKDVNDMSNLPASDKPAVKKKTVGTVNTSAPKKTTAAKKSCFFCRGKASRQEKPLFCRSKARRQKDSFFLCQEAFRRSKEASSVQTAHRP